MKVASVWNSETCWKDRYARLFSKSNYTSFFEGKLCVGDYALMKGTCQVCLPISFTGEICDCGTLRVPQDSLCRHFRWDRTLLHSTSALLLSSSYSQGTPGEPLVAVHRKRHRDGSLEILRIFQVQLVSPQHERKKLILAYVPPNASLRLLV